MQTGLPFVLIGIAGSRCVQGKQLPTMRKENGMTECLDYNYTEPSNTKVEGSGLVVCLYASLSTRAVLPV
jgi:hypothetical protein